MQPSPSCCSIRSDASDCQNRIETEPQCCKAETQRNCTSQSFTFLGMRSRDSPIAFYRLSVIIFAELCALHLARVKALANRLSIT